MITSPVAPTQSPVMVPPAPRGAPSAMPPASGGSPKSRTTTRAAPNPPVIPGSLDRRRRVGARCDDDRGPVGDDLAHRPRQLRAVEPHRQDGVRAEECRVGDEPVECLATSVFEEARVLVDLAAAERSE